MPQSLADWYQCKGRTARAGKFGRFKIIINVEGLKIHPLVEN
jgi:hypothetical protein